MACANIVTSARIIIKGIVLAAATVLVVTTAACGARKPPVAAPEANREAPAVSIDPTTPSGAVAVTKELVGQRRSVYSSATGKYSYFIGGELAAEYDSDLRVLVITGEGGDDGAVCKYSADGALFIAAKTASEAQCNALITRLYRHMQR